MNRQRWLYWLQISGEEFIDGPILRRSAETVNPMYKPGSISPGVQGRTWLLCEDCAALFALYGFDPEEVRSHAKPARD